MVQRRDAAGRLPRWSFAAGVAITVVLLMSGGAVAETVAESSHPPVKLSEVREARLLIRDGELERARELLEQARPSAVKDQIERLRLLGQLEMRLGLPEHAAERFEAILAIRPGLARIRLELLHAQRLSRNALSPDDAPRLCCKVGVDW